MRRFLLKAVQLPLALIVMFYEWGWNTLSRGFDWLAHRPVWAWVESQVRRLPPYPAMLLFALPSIAMIPGKLAAFWLLANGYALSGSLALVAAKLAGTAIVARLFTLTQPALMRMSWFARFYRWFKPWKDGWMNWLRASAPWQLAHRARARLQMQLQTSLNAARTIIGAMLKDK